MRGVDFKVCLATPGEMLMMFNLMQSIALYILRTLEVASKSSIAPLLVVLALQDARIHICPTNSSNEATNIETMIDE